MNSLTTSRFCVNRICRIFALLGLLFSLSAYSGQQVILADKSAPADAPGNAATQAAEDEEPIALEKLSVVGQRVTLSLRRELFHTQDRIYDMFNDLNTDDDYDVICRKEAPIGSQIRYETCKPRINWVEEGEAWSDVLEGGWVDLSPVRINRHNLRQREIMADMANKNPAFMGLLERRLELRKAYEGRFDRKK